MIKTRIDWVDALRALAIILVIYGHQVRSFSLFYIFSSPIKMPLFFAITGFVFSPKGWDTKVFFKNLFFKLVIPWWCLAMAPILVVAPFQPFSSLLDKMWELLSGERVWFMPCIVVAEILHFFVRKYAKNIRIVVLLSLLLTIIGFVCYHCHVLSFAMINRALSVQLFIAFGYVMRTYFEKLSQIKNSWIVLSVIAYLSMCFINLFFFPQRGIDVHMISYFNIPFCFCEIFVGLFMCFMVASKIKTYPRWFLFLGQNTIVLYIWHCLSLIAMNAIFARLGISISCVPVKGLVGTVFACVICGIASLLLARYVPFVLGKKKIRK